MFQPNGISLHVEDHGSGKPMALLHGCFAFVALRDGCVTNEDELREHAPAPAGGFVETLARRAPGHRLSL